MTKIMGESSIPFKLLSSYCRQNRSWRMTYPAKKFLIVNVPLNAWNTLHRDDVHGLRCVQDRLTVVVHKDTTFVIPATRDGHPCDIRVTRRGGYMTVTHAQQDACA